MHLQDTPDIIAAKKEFAELVNKQPKQLQLAPDLKERLTVALSKPHAAALSGVQPIHDRRCDLRDIVTVHRNACAHTTGRDTTVTPKAAEAIMQINGTSSWPGEVEMSRCVITEQRLQQETPGFAPVMTLPRL